MYLVKIWLDYEMHLLYQRMWCLLAIHGRHCLVECSFHGHDLDQVNHQGVANGLEFLLKRFQLLLQFGNRLVLALFGLTGQEHISNLRKHLVTTHKEQNSDQTQTRPNYLRKHQNINRTNRLVRSNCLCFLVRLVLRLFFGLWCLSGSKISNVGLQLLNSLTLRISLLLELVYQRSACVDGSRSQEMLQIIQNSFWRVLMLLQCCDALCGHITCQLISLVCLCVCASRLQQT